MGFTERNNQSSQSFEQYNIFIVLQPGEFQFLEATKMNF